MHVSSIHDDGLYKFRNALNSLGRIISLPPFSFEEFKMADGLSIGKNQYLNLEELQFLYDIFGGSLRLLREKESNVSNECIYDFVKNEIEFYFEDVFMSNHNEELVLISYKDQFLNACRVISSKLSFQDPRISPDLNAAVTFRSLFKHHLHLRTDNGVQIWNDDYASGFMKSLAGGIIKNENTNILTELKNIVGASGMGCLFERQAHETIYNNLKSSGVYSLDYLASFGTSKSKGNKNNKVLKQNITRKVLIRRIEDINSLLVTDYGLPVIPNFPLVDAVIQPKYLLQDTMGRTHKGAVGKLESIREQLIEYDRSEHLMIFFLSHSNYDNFKHISSLDTIKQYKSQVDFMTENEQSVPIKKKRA